MGIEIHFEGESTNQHCEKCQICNGVIILESFKSIDSPSFHERECIKCDHFFHTSCIKTNFDIYINKKHAFEIHCQKCGYLENFTKKYKIKYGIYAPLITASSITQNPNLSMEYN